MGEAIQFLQFIIENAGVLLTVLFLIILFPMIVAILNWKSYHDLQKGLEEKIEEQSKTLTDLYATQRGMFLIINSLISQAGIINTKIMPDTNAKKFYQDDERGKNDDA